MKARPLLALRMQQNDMPPYNHFIPQRPIPIIFSSFFVGEVPTYPDIVDYKDKIEGKCMKHGYVKKGSVSIIKRSGEICNPSIGTVLRSRIVAINHTAAKAEYTYNGDVIIEFLIPRITAGIVSEIDIDTLKVGDMVNVEVYGGKKYKLNDTCINIIGKIIKDDKEINQDFVCEKDEYTEEEPKYEDEEIEQEEEDDDDDNKSATDDKDDDDSEINNDIDADDDIEQIDEFDDLPDEADDINFDDD
ncbi:hypothetical protein GUITHDRAFT_121964 [Guillardia theta CCMP2712]|uniref:S1 motif domain-containing protein n=1 Tax=Guillardia theta (strain CCMP2712) TaxID=905079 RepID=L1I713_GUITC|nr:hypothetical protein GUITHDRAFT_121964 [Guillardia theta CCMP2712]EKX31847.1 hypothetical protein GUITHDRAFT_121964 [Guillardia theta CCMP2712]|eukprot:XP_005818827.1 hypothetical protein GUITHDRAFT_121964 [Guillardia theta CCMP2712]